jgi:hypothetical protein
MGIQRVGRFRHTVHIEPVIQFFPVGLPMRAALSFLLVVFLVGCSTSNSRSSGSSVVVLIDFSKSFVPLSQDERALREVSLASAKLAEQEWQPPVTFLWSRIQSASLISAPLCESFQYQQSLIKGNNDDSAHIT